MKHRSDRSRPRSAATVAALAIAAAGAAACGENEVATAHIQSVVAAADSGAGGAVAELPNGDTMHIRPAVVEFYKARQFQPAWTNDDEILSRGLSMLEAIGQADAEGLDRERYHYTTALHMAHLLNDDEVEDRELEYLGNLDLILTENFARLSQDLMAGTIDPTSGGLEWEIERGEVEDRDLIESVFAGKDPKEVLDSIRPRVPHYGRLAGALERLREVQKAGGWPTVSGGETLEPGQSDPRVAELRARLSAGDDPDETRLARHGADSPATFDDSLVVALKHFQTRHSMHDDGTLGPATLEALNVPVEDRVAAVRFNLDRWRWLPLDLGQSFIMVNIAGFELEVVHEGKTIETMNVVVGETANRTPIFQDTLEYMVVNPYWNVPTSIAEEEILPVARRDPGYLARNHYETVPGSGGQRIRQRPGPWNALGQVKFLFPNDKNIYLHDTPADHLFSQASRAFSHGCIRVERPHDLAKTLLGAFSDKDPDTYERLLAREGEQWLEFDQKVPVYILYFTSWVDEDGTIRFHDDIYDRDSSLEEERRKKLDPVNRRPIADA